MEFDQCVTFPISSTDGMFASRNAIISSILEVERTDIAASVGIMTNNLNIKTPMVFILLYRFSVNNLSSG